MEPGNGLERLGRPSEVTRGLPNLEALVFQVHRASGTHPTPGLVVQVAQLLGMCLVTLKGFTVFARECLGLMTPRYLYHRWSLFGRTTPILHHWNHQTVGVTDCSSQLDAYQHDQPFKT